MPYLTVKLNIHGPLFCGKEWVIQAERLYLQLRQRCYIVGVSRRQGARRIECRFRNCACCLYIHASIGKYIKSQMAYSVPVLDSVNRGTKSIYRRYIVKLDQLRSTLTFFICLVSICSLFSCLAGDTTMLPIRYRH
jgi:hypothetical protein